MSAETGLQRLEQAADAFVGRLSQEPGSRRWPAPDFLALAERAGALTRPARWWNVLIELPMLRRAHVEYFAIAEQIAVLHVCAFPRLHLSAPIFGFDVIAGAQKVTGAFLDLSPLDTASAERAAAWGRAHGPKRAAFSQTRTLPDWAEAIFSEHALAVRPNSPQELEAALDLGAETLRWFLGQDWPLAADPLAMAEAQDRYCLGQRANLHTFRMLAGLVGEALATRFIVEQLFPLQGVALSR